MRIEISPEAQQVLDANAAFRDALSERLRAATFAARCTIAGPPPGGQGLTITCDGRSAALVSPAELADAGSVAALVARLKIHASSWPTLRGFLNFLTSADAWTILWRIFLLVLLFFAGAFVYRLLFPGSDGLAGPDLKDGTYMRGFITTLFLVATLALVIVLVLFVSFAGNDISTKDRVTQAREILTPIFGILGTIVGFYFGSQIPGKPESAEGPARQAAPGAAVEGSGKAGPAQTGRGAGRDATAKGP
jgi:hypothetical protein